MSFCYIACCSPRPRRRRRYRLRYSVYDLTPPPSLPVIVRQPLFDEVYIPPLGALRPIKALPTASAFPLVPRAPLLGIEPELLNPAIFFNNIARQSPLLLPQSEPLILPAYIPEPPPVQLLSAVQHPDPTLVRQLPPILPPAVVQNNLQPVLPPSIIDNRILDNHLLDLSIHPFHHNPIRHNEIYNPVQNNLNFNRLNIYNPVGIYQVQNQHQTQRVCYHNNTKVQIIITLPNQAPPRPNSPSNSAPSQPGRHLSSRDRDPTFGHPPNERPPMAGFNLGLGRDRYIREEDLEAILVTTISSILGSDWFSRNNDLRLGPLRNLAGYSESERRLQEGILTDFIRRHNLAVQLANTLASIHIATCQVHPKVIDSGPDVGRFPRDFEVPRRMDWFGTLDNTTLDRLLAAYGLPTNGYRDSLDSYRDRLRGLSWFNNVRRDDTFQDRLVALLEFLGVNPRELDRLSDDPLRRRDRDRDRIDPLGIGRVSLGASSLARSRGTVGWTSPD